MEIQLPTTLNLMVSSRCNSRCRMCGVWRKKHARELSPQELSAVLRDPLFRLLRYVGISGGEPTLRTDLPEIFSVIAEREGMQGAGLITNALDADGVIEQILKCNSVCRDAGLAFNVMVSLDGAGPVHDLVRGRTGNFENARRVIRYIRDHTDISLAIGCTVIKDNVWNIDEVLDFCREEKVRGRFRAGEFIDRLSNHGCTESIRNFDDDERYQIALFFYRLEHHYEDSPSVRETYRNIRGMIYSNAPRSSGCPYLSEAVGLDSTGNLLFCSPKSPILGSCLERSAADMFRENLHIRNEISQKHCSSCIHDYHAEPSRQSIQERQGETFYRECLSVEEALKQSMKIQSPMPVSAEGSSFRKPLIVGWYGTETAGDKAILDVIVRKLITGNPDTAVMIASEHPFITKRTLYELGLDPRAVRIVKTLSPEYMSACSEADAVIMGGGPLMSIEPLGRVLAAFTAARQRGIPAIIEGCGIGPLSEGKYTSAVKEIIRLSTTIRVRDTASLEWVLSNTGRRDAVCSGDPAVQFCRNWTALEKTASSGKASMYFACLLRELPPKYENGMSAAGYQAFRVRFERELAGMIRFLRDKTGLTPLFVPMHTFVVGHDDREFARRFARAHLRDGEYELAGRVYSPADILSVMAGVRFNLCMRFHSVLFAESTDVPFFAIDYTGGGKIKGYLRDRGKEHLMIDRSDLSEGRWQHRVRSIVAHIMPGETMKSSEPDNMNVLHICTRDDGGAGTAAYRLHSGLKSIGLTSSMLVARSSRADRDMEVVKQRGNMQDYKRQMEEDFKRYEKSRPKGLDVFSDDRSVYRLSGHPLVNGADIINLHWVSWIVDYQEFFSSCTGKPVVWTLHDMNPFTGGCHYTGGCEKYRTECRECPQLGSSDPEDLAHQIWLRKKQAYEGQYIHCVTPSTWLAERVRESRLLGRCEVTVLPNGVSTSAFMKRDRNFSRELLGLPKDRIVILFGAHNPDVARKGFHYLKEAMKLIEEGGDTQRLAVALFGMNSDTLTEGMSCPVYPLGVVHDELLLSVCYSAADLFVIPSLEDNLPNTVLESMACETPVVGFNTGGIPDMVRDGISGHLASACDHQDLARKILLLTENSDYRQKVGAQARRIVEQEYSIEVQARAYRELYGNILNSAKALRQAHDTNRQGEELYLRGDIDAAVDCFNRSIRTSPRFITPYNNLGVVCWETGDVRQALHYFSQALRLDHHDRETVLNCGKVLLSLGESGDARKLYSSYLKANPGDSEVLSLMGEMGGG